MEMSRLESRLAPAVKTILESHSEEPQDRILLHLRLNNGWTYWHPSRQGAARYR